MPWNGRTFVEHGPEVLAPIVHSQRRRARAVEENFTEAELERSIDVATIRVQNERISFEL